MPALAAPDPVDNNGTTPLCTACHLGLDKVTAALCDGGAKIDYVHTRPVATHLMSVVR
jgi:hypothetical protein